MTTKYRGAAIGYSGALSSAHPCIAAPRIPSPASGGRKGRGFFLFAEVTYICYLFKRNEKIEEKPALLCGNLRMGDIMTHPKLAEMMSKSEFCPHRLRINLKRGGEPGLNPRYL